MAKHLHLKRISAMGAASVWRCEGCRAEGPLSDLQTSSCPAVKAGTLSHEEQVDDWVDGVPSCPNTDGECCPDFSCCTPTLLAPLAVRRAFKAASPEERMKFYHQFLSAAVETVVPGEKVHVVAVGNAEDAKTPHIVVLPSKDNIH